MRALVISGGGSKGAFAVGILKKLLRQYPALDFDCYVGTSTGALMVPLIALKEMALLERLYSTQNTADIIKTHRLGDRLNEDSIFDASPLANLLLKHYTDGLFTRLQQSGKQVCITAACLQTENLHVFSTATPVVSKYYESRRLENGSHFRRAVMASASQPVFMPPVKVNEKIPGELKPHYQFVDGGLKEYAGVQMAIDQGATEIFIILLSASLPPDDGKQYTKLFPILEKTVSIFIDDVSRNDLVIPRQYNEALQYIQAVKNKMKRAGMTPADIDQLFHIRGRENPYESKVPLQIFEFRPRLPLGGGSGGLSFDPAEMKAMIKKGEEAAGDFIATLDPATITWV